MPSLNYLKSKVPLSSFQDKRSFRNTLFRYLVVRGLPEEWAYIIAEEVIPGHYRREWITSGYSVSTIIIAGFFWAETEMGLTFWEAAYDGIAAEERAIAIENAAAGLNKSYF